MQNGTDKKLAAEMLSDTLKRVDKARGKKMLRVARAVAERALSEFKRQVELLPGYNADKTVDGVREALQYRQIAEIIIADLQDFMIDVDFRITEIEVNDDASSAPASN